MPQSNYILSDLSDWKQDLEKSSRGYHMRKKQTNQKIKINLVVVFAEKEISMLLTIYGLLI